VSDDLTREQVNDSPKYDPCALVNCEYEARLYDSLRHGQSVWNLETMFAGWKDVDLSDHGIAEACDTGMLLGGKGSRLRSREQPSRPGKISRWHPR